MAINVPYDTGTKNNSHSWPESWPSYKVNKVYAAAKNY